MSASSDLLPTGQTEEGAAAIRQPQGGLPVVGGDVGEGTYVHALS